MHVWSQWRAVESICVHQVLSHTDRLCLGVQGRVMILWLLWAHCNPLGSPHLPLTEQWALGSVKGLSSLFVVAAVTLTVSPGTACGNRPRWWFSDCWNLRTWRPWRKSWCFLRHTLKCWNVASCFSVLQFSTLCVLYYICNYIYAYVYNVYRHIYTHIYLITKYKAGSY